jgi:hypothetical protein
MPSAGQAQRVRRTIASWPNTSAQHQQQIKGESMVMIVLLTATIGNVNAPTTTRQENLSEW